MSGRASQSGVTLIEMLVALAISAMISVAGFVFLDSLTRTESGIAGRLERLALQDRAFHLLVLDLQNATEAELGQELELQVAGQSIDWRASETGLVRSITFQDGAIIRQELLSEPATITRHAPGILALRLTETGVWRLLPFATGPAR